MTTPNPQNVEQLSSAVEGLAGIVLDYSMLLAGVATVTVALLELVKSITFARRHFHRWRIRRWLNQQKNAQDNCLLYCQVVGLTVGSQSSEGALFDQPTEKMMGQLQAAATTALEFPSRFPEFYAFITDTTLIPDYQRVPSPKQPTSTPAAVTSLTDAGEPESRLTPEQHRNDDANAWRWFQGEKEREQATRLSKYALAPAKAPPPMNQEAAEAPAPIASRARLDHYVTRKLDAFQVATEYQWARLNQTVAVVGCGVFLFYVLQQVSGDSPQAVINGTVRNVILAIFGGMIAPAAKDIVSALTGFKIRQS